MKGTTILATRTTSSVNTAWLFHCVTRLNESHCRHRGNPHSQPHVPKHSTLITFIYPRPGTLHMASFLFLFFCVFFCFSLFFLVGFFFWFLFSAQITVKSKGEPFLGSLASQDRSANMPPESPADKESFGKHVHLSYHPNGEGFLQHLALTLSSFTFCVLG